MERTLLQAAISPSLDGDGPVRAERAMAGPSRSAPIPIPLGPIPLGHVARHVKQDQQLDAARVSGASGTVLGVLPFLFSTLAFTRGTVPRCPK